MIGIHIDIDPPFDDLLKYHKLGIIQLFVNSKYKHYDELAKFLINNKIKCVVHASYTINLASDWTEYSWNVKQFIEEIELASKINAIGIVVHMGKQLDLSLEKAYNNMYTALLHVHNQTKKYQNIKIILETSTGQGSEICYKIEDLIYFFSKFINHPNKEINNRFRLCLDTCHIFSAGYDLRDKKNINNYLKLIKKQIGFKYIALIHLNDSKKDLGQHVDRHENIGNGCIGKSGLVYFANVFKKLDIPIILETPFQKNNDELKLLNK